MDMQKMFEMSQQNQSSNLEITKEEAERFKNAFEDPEFCKLMAEYVAELQDPSNREENESYITQLENENKVPEGKELIRPTAGFVAKTHKTEKGIESKVFVNIVSSNKIASPTKKETKQGQNWSLPYSLGPPHMEKDKNGDSVASFDCCFHPEALQLSERSKQFRDLLVSTAISGIEEAYRRQRIEVTLQKEFHVLKGVLYKSGQIPTMLIDIAGKNKWSETESTTNTPLPSSNNSVQSINSTSTTEAKQSNKQSTPAIQKGFLNKPSKTKTPASAASAPASSAPAATTTPPLVQELSSEERRQLQPKPSNPPPSGPISPEFSLTERGVVSLGDFETGNGMKVSSTRPAELVYRIEIPLVVKTSEVELDVSERDLKLKYSSVYDLHIVLPYPVNDKKGIAKFDKGKKQLSITLPVLPHAPIQSSSDKITESIKSEKSEAETEETTITKQEKKSQPTSTTPAISKPSKTSSHERWVEKNSTDESKQLHQEIQLKAEEAKQLAAKQLEEQKAEAKTKSVASPTKSTTTTTASSSTTETFLPSEQFKGEKKGYVFKRGENGMGYYYDHYQSVESVNQLKLSSSISTTAASPQSSTMRAAGSPKNHSQSFQFEYRQTKEMIAIIIQISGVIESTVDIQFNPQSFDLSFQSLVEQLQENGEMTSTIHSYSQGFDLWSEVIPQECKFEIATQNMMILLQKKQNEYWMDKSTPKKEIIVGREYQPRQSLRMTSDKNEKAKNESEKIVIPSPSQLLDDMKFNTMGLFELD